MYHLSSVKWFLHLKLMTSVPVLPVCQSLGSSVVLIPRHPFPNCPTAFYKWLTFTSEPCHLQCCHSILSPETLLVAHFIFIARWWIRHSAPSDIGLSGVCCVPGSLMWPMRTNQTLSLLSPNHNVMGETSVHRSWWHNPLITQTSPQDFGPETDDGKKEPTGNHSWCVRHVVEWGTHFCHKVRFSVCRTQR